MGRHEYPAKFRRKVLDLVQAGRSVANVAATGSCAGASHVETPALRRDACPLSRSSARWPLP